MVYERLRCEPWLEAVGRWERLPTGLEGRRPARRVHTTTQPRTQDAQASTVEKGINTPFTVATAMRFLSLLWKLGEGGGDETGIALLV